MHPTIYSSDAESAYECRHCLARVTRDQQPVECPDCGGPLQNLTVPRE